MDVNLNGHWGAIRQTLGQQSINGRFGPHRQRGCHRIADIEVGMSCRRGSDEVIRWDDQKYLPQRRELTVPGRTGHRVQNMVVEVDEIDPLAVVVARLTLWAETARRPVDRIDDLIEVSEGSVVRHIRDFDRIYRDRLAKHKCFFIAGRATGLNRVAANEKSEQSRRR